MAEQADPAPYELLEVNELLQSEVISLKKLQASLENVRDAQLRGLMQNTLDAKRGRIAALYRLAQEEGQERQAAGPGQNRMH